MLNKNNSVMIKCSVGLFKGRNKSSSAKFIVLQLFFLFSSFLFSRVNDEKEARGYLQGLATKMTDELESVRAPGPPGTGKVNCISFLIFILHLF